LSKHGRGGTGGGGDRGEHGRGRAHRRTGR
jgi:hypothetical protein